jgi:hypothetical protein
MEPRLGTFPVLGFWHASSSISTIVTCPWIGFNFAATVFGSCHKLEPLPAGKKAMWTREMDCLLSVCDYIVEFYPSTQTLPDGTKVEVLHCIALHCIALHHIFIHPWISSFLQDSVLPINLKNVVSLPIETRHYC